MLKTAATLLLIALLALAGCGGGGDDGGNDDVLLRQTTTGAEPNSASTSRNDWLVSMQSGITPATLSGDWRVRTCITGTWRQTLKSPATLRLIVSVGGQQVQTINNIAGIAGANSISFSGCSETFSRSTTPTSTRGSAVFDLRAMDNRAAFPVDGYDVTIDWTVTRL